MLLRNNIWNTTQDQLSPGLSAMKPVVIIFHGGVWRGASTRSGPNSLFVRFPWRLLRMMNNLTKDSHLFYPHNMLRRLALCSHSGFEMKGQLCNIQKNYVFAKEWKWVQIVTKTQCLKKTLPSGVSPPWDSPAISLPLLSSNWLVPPPILPQWKWTKPLRKGRLLWNVPSKDWNEISMS